MKIEAGKYYKSRDGQVFGPLFFTSNPFYPWVCGDRSWTIDGEFERLVRSELDLVEEAPSPGGISHEDIDRRIQENLKQQTSTDPKGQAGSEKPQLHLIPTIAMQELAASLADGAARYGAYNWRDTRVSASTYISAMMRHTDAYRDGEELTTDSLVTHLGAIMANCSILLDAAKHGTLDDDRPKR